MNAAVQLVVDWVVLLEQLRDAGIRTGTISEHTGVAVSTLREYRLGIKSPLHSSGERIVLFWCRALARSRDDLPTTEQLPNAHRR